MVSCLFFWGTIHQWCLKTTNGRLWWKRCCIMTRSLERFATRYGEGERKNNFPRPANIEQAKNEKLCIDTTKASRTLPQAIYPGVKFLSRSNNSGNSSNGTILKIVRTFRLQIFALSTIDLMKCRRKIFCSHDERTFPFEMKNHKVIGEKVAQFLLCRVQDLICIVLRNLNETRI